MSFMALRRFAMVIGPQPLSAAIRGCLQTLTVLMTQTPSFMHAVGHLFAVIPAKMLGSFGTRGGAAVSLRRFGVRLDLGVMGAVGSVTAIVVSVMRPLHAAFASG